jgi:hypothetical protein
VVALDGTKIAANAAMAANRTEEHHRNLAEQHLAGAAATDAAEDARYGDARGDEPPPDLRDRTGRAQRIQQALDEIAARQAATDKPSQHTAAEYVTALAAAAGGAPDTAPPGRTPKAADLVTVTRLRWQRARALAQRSYDAWQAKAAALGRVPLGPRALPADEHAKVRAARAAYDAALTAATTTDDTTSTDDTNKIRANLTDPQSRPLKTRHGYIQGYNCQTAASDDQFILHAEATQDANDVQQFEPTLTAVTDLARHLAQHTGRADLSIATVLADAGYDSEHNLTTPGPDRLIPSQTRRDLAKAAATQPATGDPPADATPRQAMNHRLRTTQGHQLYKRRSPLIEATNAWLKDGRGLRRFARRGLTAARSELRLAAAVTNLLRLRTLGITTSHLATTA